MEALSQDEIDALLTAIDSGDSGSKNPESGAGKKKIKIYDFKRPTRLLKSQSRKLSIVLDKFSRISTFSLSEMLRAPVYIHVASVDELCYEEYIRSIPAISTMAINSMTPLNGNALMEIDPAITSSIINRLFGGTGKVCPSEHDLTDIESTVMKEIIIHLLENLGKAWSEVTNLQPRFVQISSNPKSVQIVRPTDMVVLATLETIVENVEGMINLCFPYATIKPIVGSLGYGDFRYIEDRAKTKDMCFDVVKLNGALLQYVPKKLRTAEMCLEAARSNPWALEYIPEEHWNTQLCLEAIKSNSLALKHIPENLKTAEMCSEAIKSSSILLQYVPEEFKTAEMCSKAVESNGILLQYVPEEHRTVEMCLEAVKFNRWALEYVPEKYLTVEFYLEAVKSAGWAIKHIPESDRTIEICLEAIKSDGRALKFVPEELITTDICLKAVGSSSWVLKELMELSVNNQKAADTINRITAKLQKQPLDFIKSIEFDDLLRLFAQEQPQTVAFILTRFEPRRAAYILQNISHNMQRNAARCIINMDISNQASLCKIMQTLEREPSLMSVEDTFYKDYVSTGGMKNIDKILDVANLVSDTQIFEVLENEDPGLAREIAAKDEQTHIKKVSSLSNSNVAVCVGGIKALIEILNFIDCASEMRIIESLEDEVPRFASSW